ncbi:CCHC-type domain-containing protein [Heracleum sosnowskyi]|nr:CCHC-type domain-containing protein [Heracleum sosnowskyi]
MASLWRPGRGMYVKDLGSNRYIFQFYHELDINRVMEGSPWTFGRFQLVFERLKEGDNPREMEINKMDIWVQLHGMSAGFMSQRVVTDIGNYIGVFVESDANNFIGAWREYLRVRVTLTLNKPLKRRMRLKKNDSNWCWVNFKFEGIPTFCFICGLIGHSEKYCEKLFDIPADQITKPYGVWMRAEPKRKTHSMGARWLRQGGGSPAKPMSAEEQVDKAIAIVQPVVGGGNPGKAGIDENEQQQSQRVDKSVVIGADKGNLNMLVGRETVVDNEMDLENVGLNITDLKRRRLNEPILHEEDTHEHEDFTDDMLENQTHATSGSKNLHMAGSAAQTRPTL